MWKKRERKVTQKHDVEKKEKEKKMLNLTI